MIGARKKFGAPLEQLNKMYYNGRKQHGYSNDQRNGNKKLSMDELNAIENAIRWDYVKEDFERDRHRKESVFYGM